MFKGTVGVGAQVVVTFTAAAGNIGSSSLLVGFIPSTAGGNTQSQFAMVAPGGGQSLSTVVPASWALDIRVDVPGPADIGVLEVYENGILKDRDNTGDTIWTYGVI